MSGGAFGEMLTQPWSRLCVPGAAPARRRLGEERLLPKLTDPAAGGHKAGLVPGSCRCCRRSRAPRPSPGAPAGSPRDIEHPGVIHLALLRDFPREKPFLSPGEAEICFWLLLGSDILSETCALRKARPRPRVLHASGAGVRLCQAGICSWISFRACRSQVSVLARFPRSPCVCRARSQAVFRRYAPSRLSFYRKELRRNEGALLRGFALRLTQFLQIICNSSGFC